MDRNKLCKWMIGVVLIAMLLTGCSMCISQIYTVRTFCLEDYVENMSVPASYQGLKLGKIENATQARCAAKDLFAMVYTDATMSITVPYIVSYDAQSDTWLVQAGMYFIPAGGAHVIINASNGAILGLWNFKF